MRGLKRKGLALEYMFKTEAYFQFLPYHALNDKINSDIKKNITHSKF